MKNKLKKIKEYIVGNFRYFVYHKRLLKFMVRKHIQEQYLMRIKIMNKECYSSGSCIECGCTTTKLQFANKACDGKCYPKFMNRYNWFMFKSGVLKYKDEFGIWSLSKKEDTYYLFLNGKIKKRFYGKIF